MADLKEKKSDKLRGMIVFLAQHRREGRTWPEIASIICEQNQGFSVNAEELRVYWQRMSKSRKPAEVLADEAFEQLLFDRMRPSIDIIERALSAERARNSVLADKLNEALRRTDKLEADLQHERARNAALAAEMSEAKAELLHLLMSVPIRDFPEPEDYE